MKKIFLIMFIILGTITALILPITGITALVVPVQSDQVKLENEEELKENNKDNEKDDTTIEDDNKNTKNDNKDNNSNNVKINATKSEEIKIVSGDSVKQSFIYHKDKVDKQTLTFMVIDKDKDVTYYYDYEQLDKDISDTKKYEKQFELNLNGELVKYIYTECK